MKTPVEWFRRAAGIVTRWKFRLAIVLLGFFLLGAVVSPFLPELRASGVLLYLGLAFIPVLYLASATRIASADPSPQGRRARAVRVWRFEKSNWVPIGAVVAAGLIIGGAALAPTPPARDPDAVMPDVVGMSLNDASEQLDELDLRVLTEDATGADRDVWVERNWVVTSQQIAAGDRLGDRAEVRLEVVKHDEKPESQTATDTADLAIPTSSPMQPDRASTERASTTASPPSTTSTTSTIAPTSPSSAPEQSHSACALLDSSVLEAARMSPTLGNSVSIASPTDDDVIASYACGNDLDEVILQVDVHRDAAAAREAAEFDTRPDITESPAYPGSARIPLADDLGGAKVISTEAGTTRVSWSTGVHSFMLEVYSDPVIDGHSSRHPFDVLDRMVDSVVSNATQRVSSGTW